MVRARRPDSGTSRPPEWGVPTDRPPVASTRGPRSPSSRLVLLAAMAFLLLHGPRFETTAAFDDESVAVSCGRSSRSAGRRTTRRSRTRPRAPTATTSGAGRPTSRAGTASPGTARSAGTPTSASSRCSRCRPRSACRRSSGRGHVRLRPRGLTLRLGQQRDDRLGDGVGPVDHHQVAAVVDDDVPRPGAVRQHALLAHPAGSAPGREHDARGARPRGRLQQVLQVRELVAVRGLLGHQAGQGVRAAEGSSVPGGRL